MNGQESLLNPDLSETLKGLVQQNLGQANPFDRLKEMVRQDLINSGYEIIGELPKERPAEVTVGGQKYFPGIEKVPTETIGPYRGGEYVPTLHEMGKSYEPIRLEAEKSFWQQLKDVIKGSVTGEIDPFGLAAREVIKGASLGNIDVPKIVEKVAGKKGKGFADNFRQLEREYMTEEFGYVPSKGLKAIEAPAQIAGAFATYSQILRGASAVTKGASDIPALQGIARAEVGGAISGMLRKPEDEGFLNRIKQIPGDVLFFTALEMGALTFNKAKKIYDWNKQYGGKAPGVRQRVISTEIGGEPPETKRLSLDELKKLFNRMQARTAGRTEYDGESLNWQQWEQDLTETLKGTPGWRHVFREGYRPEATIPGKPGAGWQSYALERDWFPRKPKLGDIFKRMEKHTVFDEMGREVVDEWDVPKGESPWERTVHPERDPYSSFIGDRGRPGAEVPPTEAPPTAAPPPRGPQPKVSGPVVLVDVKPKRGGGWEYEFKIPTEPTEAAAATKIIDFTPTAELPPHLKERVVTPPKKPRAKKPKGWANPFYQDIFDYGKIKPSVDYPDLHRLVPPGLLSKQGQAIDVLAQELSHKYPGIESDGDLYEMLEAIVAGRAKFRNRDTGEEFDAQAEEDYYAAQAEEFNRKEAEGEPMLKQEAKYDQEAFGAYVRTGRLTPQEYAQRKAMKPRYEAYLREKYAKKYEETPPGKRRAGETKKAIVVPSEMPEGPPTAFTLSDPDATWDDVVNYYKNLPDTDPRKASFPDNPKEYEAYVFSTWPEMDPSDKHHSIYGRKEAEAGVLEDDFAPRGEEPFYVTPEGQAIPESKFRIIKQLDALARAGKTFKYKDLFGKEIKVESDKKPEKVRIEQPKLFEMEEREGKYPKPFDNRGLAKFSDVNKFRKAVQPALDEGYLVEYGHKAGAEGWAKIKDKREPGKGKLMSVGVKRPEMGDLREKVEPTLEAEAKKPAFNKDIAMAEIERVVRARWPGRDKSWVDNLVNEIAPDIVRTFKPEKGVKLNTYITGILKKRYWPDGTVIDQKAKVPKEKQKEFVKVGRAKPSKSPQALFEEKQTVERARNLFKKTAKDKKRDPEILEDYILNEKAQEAIGKEHGITQQAVNKILLEAIEKMKGDPDIIRLLNERHIKMNLGPLPSEKDLRRAAGWMSRYFSSRKGASYEIDLENDKRIGGFLSEYFLATLDAKDLIKATKKYRSEAVDRLIYDVLRGHTPIESTTLPDNAKAILNQMRQRIDMLSMQIVAHGGLKEQTRAGIMNNLGKYVKQTYRLHQSKHWDPPEEARLALIDRMKADDPDRYGHMTNDEMNEILERIIEQERADAGFGGKAKQKRIPTDSYIRRKELSQEWKNFAGIIEDEPYFSYLQTVTKQASMAHNAKFLNAIKAEYPDLWASTVAGDPKRERWPRLPETYGYGEMAGKFVEPTLYKYITEEVDPAVSTIEKAFLKMVVNPFKWTKTIGSIPTHARNFQGNTMFSIIMKNFVLNPMNSPYYADALKTFTMRNRGRRLEWANLVKVGVTETQFYGAEIPKLYNQLMKVDPIEWPERLYRATAGWGIEKLGNLYNFEDALYRIAAHYKNVRHFGMSPEESVREINLGMTNYRKLPVMVDILRRWPVFGPFISFRWNVAKILGSQFAQAGSEMAKAGTRGKGLYRLLRVLFALGIPTLLSEISKRVYDVDDEKIKELEKYYLDYRRNGIFIYFPWKGTLKTLDLSYIYPTGEFEKGIRAALKGDISSMKEAMDFMAHPVFDTWSILVQGRYPQWAGKVPGGLVGRAAEAAKLLWIPASAPIPSFKSLTESLKEGTFKPRAGKLTPYQIDTLIRAWNQEPDAWGRTRNFPEEVKNFFTGLRTWDVDPQKELARYMRMKQAEARDVMTEAKMWSKRNTKSPTWEQIDKATGTIKELKKIAEDLQGAGELWQKLEKSGWVLFERQTKPGVTKSSAKWEEKPKAINWKKILEEYN